MTKANIVFALLLVGALALAGAWWIASVGPVLDNANYNAFLAAGGFFVAAGFVVERVR